MQVVEQTSVLRREVEAKDRDLGPSLQEKWTATGMHKMTREMGKMRREKALGHQH